MDFIVFFLTANMLLYSAYYDITTYKIPNFLTFPTMFIGLVLSIANKTNLFIILVSIILLFIIGIVGMMGMGDVKMYMAILLLNGVKISVYTLGISCLLLIFYALICHFKEFIKELSDLLSFNVIALAETENKRKYPFAVFTFWGYLFVNLFEIGGFIAL
jgi:Flp pilus assembly protein protease CpaA